MRKYKILENDIIKYQGRTLFRIQRRFDGKIGGYIESEENLSHRGSCFIFENAKVYGNAIVLDSAEIHDNAEIFEDARIYGEVKIYGNAEVYGNARVFGKAEVCEGARIYGNSIVYGNAKVYGEARVYGNARVCEDCDILGITEIYENAKVYGEARVYDTADVCGHAKVFGKAKVWGDMKIRYGVTSRKIESYLDKVYIQNATSIPVINGKMIVYKKALKQGEKIVSIYDNTFEYKKGIVICEDYEKDMEIDCGKGLHFSHADYWPSGDVMIMAEVRYKDIITCLSGKIRVKKAKILGWEKV